ncbi:aminoglycoside phosphotransferase family protein [Micromonospora sp. NPDC049060]|uniref:phosphotransferase family protein n=1 Tax=Micromonospora sp. NPDC049060 TaxID=3154828 RepID=UPI0033DDF187
MVDHDSVDWPARFSGLGFAGAEVIGRGMEGEVYSLGDGLVGKVWFRRQRAELEPLRGFYTHLSDQRLSFRTPEILDIHEMAGHTVTVERELSGVPLRDALRSGQVTVEQAQHCMLAILAELRATAAGVSCRALTVIDEDIPAWQGHDTWHSALSALLDRRVERYGGQLAASVDGFDELMKRIRLLIEHLPAGPGTIVHGDLVPANVLVTADGAPAAVLDWGFLTTEADPAFEASVTAAIFDMYGSEHRTFDQELLRRLHDQAGYPMTRLLLYRAVYAVLTSNAYDPTGKDGHYDWCAAMLQREDVVAALYADPSDL